MDINIMNTELCPICHDNIIDNETTILCGHKFDYNCILMEFKHNYKRVYGFKNKCPYCRQPAGYLKLDKNTIPIEGIHIEYDSFIQFKNTNDLENLKSFLDNTKCFYIMKSGKHKDKQCNSKQTKSSLFCTRHNTDSKTS